MFFTQDDYKKIQQWLTKNSVKDTEFNEANIPFNGEETITIVQGNQNKKVFLKDLIAQVFNLGISDFVNITDKYDAPNISLEEAIRLIPSRARKEGQVITFLDREDHWHIYQFKGVLNQWNVLDTWEDLFDWEKLIIDSILPDEEDLTKSLPNANGNSYLSLKDREYNPEDFSGLGRVILRKNIVEVEDPIYGKVKKNVLYQDMINKENTIYEIRYDFDLNGAEITIPEGCILDFQGGSLSNGVVIGNNTIVTTISNNIFSHTLGLAGSWNTNYCTPEWFGAKGDGITDDRRSLQCAFDSPFREILLGKGAYLIKSLTDVNRNIGLIVPSDKIVKGNSVNNYDSSYSIIADESVYFETLLQLSGRNITLDSIRVVGGTSYNVDYCIKSERLDFTQKWSTRNYFYKVNARYANKALLALHTFTCDVVRFTGQDSNEDGIITYSDEGRGTGLLIRKAALGGIKRYGYNIQNMSYSSLMNCSIDYNDINNNFEAYRFYDNNAIGMYNCGAEGPIKALSLTNVFGFNLESSIFVTKGSEEPVIDIIYSGQVSINNSRLAYVLETHPKFIRIDTASTHIQFNQDIYINLDTNRQTDLIYDNIECESIKNIEIINYTIKEDYNLNYATTIFSELNGKHLTRPITITANKNIDFRGNSILNTDNRITFLNSGKSNNIYLTSKFINNTNIVFIENSFVGKDTLNDYLFDIDNSHIEFIRCTFDVSLSTLQSLFKSKNSTIKIVECTGITDSLPILSTDSLGNTIICIKENEMQISSNGVWKYYTPRTDYDISYFSTILDLINNQKRLVPFNINTKRTIYSKDLNLFNINTNVTISSNSDDVTILIYCSEKPCEITSCSKIIIQGNKIEVSTSSIPLGLMNIKNSIVELRDITIPLNGINYGFKLTNSTLILNNCSIYKVGEVPLISSDSTNCKVITINDEGVQCSDNGIFINKKGSTTEKPVLNNNIGFQYFDTTLNKPIYWTGEKWVDATGADV